MSLKAAWNTVWTWEVPARAMPVLFRLALYALVFEAGLWLGVIMGWRRWAG